MAFNLSTQGHIAVFYDDEELGFQQKFIGKGIIVTTVTGMKYRPNYESTLEKLDIDVVVEAKPEPENPYDPNAIAIYYEDEIIGYVPKKDIPFIMPNVDDNGTECVIDTMDDGYVGIKLKVSFKHLGKRPQQDLPALKTAEKIRRHPWPPDRETARYCPSQRHCLPLPGRSPGSR